MDYNYNNPNNHIYQSNNYPQSEKLNSFAVASLICGLISILLCCTGVLSLPLGALGILFAVLSKRLDKPMSSFSITGIVLSTLGILMGLIACIYVLTTMPEDSTSEYDSYEDYFNEYYDNYYNDYYNDYYDNYSDESKDFYDFGFEDL